MHRKTDQIKYRVIYLLLGLCAALSILAAYEGYFALKVLGEFEKAVQRINMKDSYKDY